MADNSFFTGGGVTGPAADGGTSRRNITGGKGKLPVVSTDLDSVRTYQFEVRFDQALVSLTQAAFGGGIGAIGSVLAGAGAATDLTLAAKQVTGLSYSFQDIEVHRMNDKVFYPGKVQQEEVTITFDNLLKTRTGQILHRYLATVFDMDTGFYAPSPGGQTNYKTTLTILEFDGAGRIVQVVDLRGVYPKSFTKGEKNYANSEFDTIEVKFRYDFMRVRSPQA